MCGIAGLFLKDDRLAPDLGRLLGGMVGMLCDRGPDSAGFAVYGPGRPDTIKLTVRVMPGFDVDELFRAVDASGMPFGHERHDSHIVLFVPSAQDAAVRATLTAIPEVTIISAGRRMEMFKDVGRPDEVARRFRLAGMAGTHAIAHTRMATESAVTTAGAHPFTTGPDQCLVHNGSLSNHCSLRRDLVRHGLRFETENDSEVAAGYLTWQLREGRTLEQALDSALDKLDGFFTFVVGTETGFGVLRDRIACKPAMLAETDRWVAFGSEYRALIDLPGVETAKVWEPEPATVYQWERH
jgi:glutamate synthase domain-containing protein 1